MSKTLAQKIDWLFKTHLDERGRQHTYGQVERLCGGRITASYVWKLRTGAMQNPGLGALETLANCYGVPLDYFAEGGEYLEPLLSAGQAPQATAEERAQVALRLVRDAGHLPAKDLRAVVSLMAYLGASDEAAALPPGGPRFFA